MSTSEDIIKKVKSILDDKFEVEETTSVPDIANSKLTFGNSGLLFEATVLYIDLRGSTALLNKHNNPTVAKIHMAYFHTIVTIANLLGGEVRSFNGDSMLVFFVGTTKATLNSAVRAAMMMHYMIASKDSGINSLLSKYSEIDFGIGLDDGKILCTKIGKGGDSNTQDLIWIGNPANKSVSISDQCHSPYHIGISSYVYTNLMDETKYCIKKDAWGNTSKIDMWSSKTFLYNGQYETLYYTNYYFTVS